MVDFKDVGIKVLIEDRGTEVKGGDKSYHSERFDRYRRRYSRDDGRSFQGTCFTFNYEN